MGELIVYTSFRPSSVRPQFLTSSSLKPLGQSNSNFIWRLLRTQGMKVCSNGPGHMTKMAATPIYGKNPLKSSSPEPEGELGTWYVAFGMLGLPSLFK